MGHKWHSEAIFNNHICFGKPLLHIAMIVGLAHLLLNIIRGLFMNDGRARLHRLLRIEYGWQLLILHSYQF